jgi:hypothetical protein
MARKRDRKQKVGRIRHKREASMRDTYNLRDKIYYQESHQLIDIVHSTDSHLAEII